MMPVIPIDEARHAIAADPFYRKLDARIAVSEHRDAVLPGDDRLTVRWEGGRYAAISFSLVEDAIKDGYVAINEATGEIRVLHLQLKITERDELRELYVVERA